MCFSVNLLLTLRIIYIFINLKTVILLIINYYFFSRTIAFIITFFLLIKKRYTSLFDLTYFHKFRCLQFFS